MSLAGLHGIPGMGCSCQDRPGMGAIVPAGSGFVDQDTGRPVQAYGQGLWLDPTTGVVMGQDGRIVTNVQTDAGAASTIANLLAIPGQITGAFGVTPAQAVQLGLQVSGRAPGAVAQAAPPPASGPSAGTVALVLLGLGGAGLALGAASRRKSA